MSVCINVFDADEKLLEGRDGISLNRTDGPKYHKFLKWCSLQKDNLTWHIFPWSQKELI